MKHLKMAVFGLMYGFASPIPGLDGGTFFILFNAYEDFIHGANFKNIRKKLPVVAVFGVMCLAGLFASGLLMDFLLENYEIIMYFCFAGLITGCVPMLYKKSALNFKKHKIKLKNAVIFAAALALMLAVAFFGTQETALSFEGGYAWLFLASALSAVGMLIPGVGGAILMLVLGIYPVYIEALSNFDIATLAAMAAGMVTGILSGIKTVKKILTNYPGELYCAILGFTIGSIFVVLPNFTPGLELLPAIVGAALFIVLAYQLTKRS